MDMFREDVAALLPHLRAFARSLTAGDRQLADDIVQDTIMNALRAQHQFTPGTNLKAWLFTILRNRFKSVVVRKHVTAEVGDDDLEQNIGWPRSRRAGSRSWRSRRAFKTLSRVHREVLVLAVVHGLPSSASPRSVLRATRLFIRCRTASISAGCSSRATSDPRATCCLDADGPVRLIAKAARGKLPGGSEAAWHRGRVRLRGSRDGHKAAQAPSRDVASLKERTLDAVSPSAWPRPPAAWALAHAW